MNSSRVHGHRHIFGDDLRAVGPHVSLAPVGDVRLEAVLLDACRVEVGVVGRVAVQVKRELLAQFHDLIPRHPRLRIRIVDAGGVKMVHIEDHRHGAAVPGQTPAGVVVRLCDPAVVDVVVLVELGIRLQERLQIRGHAFARQRTCGAVGVEPHVRPRARRDHDQQCLLVVRTGHCVDLEADVRILFPVELHLLVHHTGDELTAAVEEVERDLLRRRRHTWGRGGGHTACQRCAGGREGRHLEKTASTNRVTCHLVHSPPVFKGHSYVRGRKSGSYWCFSRRAPPPLGLPVWLCKDWAYLPETRPIGNPPA